MINFDKTHFVQVQLCKDHHQQKQCHLFKIKKLLK
jgi:hypothetical protein